MNWIVDSWQLKQILELYIYFDIFISSSVKLLVVTVRFLFTNLFTNLFTIFRKKEKTYHETFPICKMKAHFETFQIWKNESTFWNLSNLEKWKHISKENHISEIFSEEWNVINPFLKKLQLAKNIKKVSRLFVGAKFNRLVVSYPEFFPFES